MKHEINVPEGCRVVSVETTDEMVVVNFEKEDPEFKENDIVCIDNSNKFIAIFKSRTGVRVINYKILLNDNSIFKDNWCFCDSIRLATDSEKQLLFDKLKEKCLMFDGENIVRWRAENGCNYCCLSSSRIDTRSEESFFSDNENYNIGNYFPTRELAESFQKQYLELLINFHKNL